MRTIKRYLASQIAQDLGRKMVFVGGPRQVGKTTLAKTFLTNNQGYLNWDVPHHREQILKNELPVTNLWVFDEIHKYHGWRNFLKGLYDIRLPDQHILVTGSARLDFYRFAGDSLQGRYHYLRMHPLSVAELASQSPKEERGKILGDLLERGGFPEPYFSGSAIEAKRWSRDYRTRLIWEDLAQLERVQDMGRIELLSLRLPELVGAPLSVNALREDLRVSHQSVSAWLDILERLYSIFRLPPFGASYIRAVKKERKHYHFDWTLVGDMPLRFENMVACSLLKWVHFQQDTLGKAIDLRYFRDIDGREVDFVITEEARPTVFIECKWNDADLSPALTYLQKKFPDARGWQISATGTKDFLDKSGIRVCPAPEFLATLV